MGAQLTEKQARFLRAFVGEAKGNATQAARLAGYRGSDATLRATASRLLRRSGIAAALEEHRRDLEAKGILTRDEILARLASIARGEVEEPHVLQSGEVVYAPPKFSDRRGALMDAARMMGLLVDRIEVRAFDGLQAQLRELQQRMSEGAFEELLRALAEDAEGAE